MSLDELITMARGRRITVLTGAGVSTASGIPDYRGPNRPKRRRAPIQHAEFVRSAATRQRYWSRSVIGWPKIRDAFPNRAHHAMAQLQSHGKIVSLITQNVDRLHTKAGSAHVTELHGALAEVICLQCSALSSRDEMQTRLLLANPDYNENPGATLAPDGDAELSVDVSDFVVVPCRLCGGTLKPHVVFFGGSVDKEIVAQCYRAVEDSELLLVCGSSLTVFSGFRFAKRAAEGGTPVVIVNLGPTRADTLATLKIEQEVGVVMDALCAAT